MNRQSHLLQNYHPINFMLNIASFYLMKVMSILIAKKIKSSCMYQCFSNITYCFNPFPNKPWFLRVCSTSHLKTLWEREKLLVTSNFSFSHSVFYPFGELSTIFIKLKIIVCKVFEFGSLKFAV